ncbi:MAG: transketolase family protein [Methanomicrobiales archaeon]|nr:transketolase family protein [Methanomicrobiales archaeon]
MYDLNVCSHNREAYGRALVELGSTNPDVVVLDADLSTSTKTSIFAERFPERFIDVGIAEQNLLDIAAGLALSGKIPFVSTFSIFGCGRGWEQIRNTIAMDSINVNIVCTHAGLSLGGDGATHQALEDIAIMRAIPNMQVIVPADPVETRAVVQYAAAYQGPVYIRLSRRRSPHLFDAAGYRFDPKSYPVLREGDDVTILSTGNMIRKALKAAECLAEDGISAGVVNVHTIKPLARDAICSIAKKTPAIVTLEEHNVIGGLGSAVAECLVQDCPVPMRIIGVEDRFGCSGRVDELFEKFNLTPAHVAGVVKNLVRER